MGILRKQISKKFTDILKILSAVLKDIQPQKRMLAARHILFVSLEFSLFKADE